MKQIEKTTASKEKQLNKSKKAKKKLVIKNQMNVYSQIIKKLL